MKRIIASIIVISFLSLLAQAQVKEVKPNSISLLNFNTQDEKEFNERYAEAQKIWKKMYEDGYEYDSLTKEEQEIYDNVGEVDDYYWAAVGGGCSWYCGGGPYEVTATSNLTSQGKNTYEPQNAHDLDYSTAWVEGVSGDGIGQYLTYHFNSHSARITNVFVANGYVKSQTAWENNGRVKKLKMYIDNKPYAILCLEDSRSVQEFEFPPIGKRDDNGNTKDDKDWTIKFEILEVYKGKKYSDVAISEIFFDGLDVHCFAKGTPVIMADGKTKPIEELAIGDVVKAYSFDNYKPTAATVEKLEKVTHTHMVKYTFKNGKEITATPDHPFMVRAKGWASSAPEKTKQYKGYEKVNEIKVGDQFLTVNAEGTMTPITLEKIEEISEEQETYTISKLSISGNFLVEGFIVGVEELE